MRRSTRKHKPKAKAKPKLLARRTYHHGNLRQVVLDATLAIADVEGVAGLSLREIARRAGVSHGAPYHHFADATAVFATLAEESFALLTAAMRTAVDAAGTTKAAGRSIRTAQARARARFEASGRAYVEFAANNPGRFRIMFRPDLADPKRHPRVERESQRARLLLVELVAEAQAAGLACEQDAAALVLTGWSTAHGLAALLVDGPLGRWAGDLPSAARTHGALVGQTLGALFVPRAARRG